MSVGAGSVFSQLLPLIGRSKFAGHVKMLKVEKHSKGLKCWDQFVAMLFYQVGQCKCLLLDTVSKGKGSGEALTCCPINTRLVLPKIMQTEELAALNDYNAWVYENLRGLLTEEEQLWLKNECLPVE